MADHMNRAEARMRMGVMAHLTVWSYTSLVVRMIRQAPPHQSQQPIRWRTQSQPYGHVSLMDSLARRMLPLLHPPGHLGSRAPWGTSTAGMGELAATIANCQPYVDAAAGRHLAGSSALEAPPLSDAPALCADTPRLRMGTAVISECWSAGRHAGWCFANIAAISACNCCAGGTGTMTGGVHDAESFGSL